MRKTLIALSLTSALFAGCSQTDEAQKETSSAPVKQSLVSSQSNVNSTLAYIPADTVFFAGGLSTLDLQKLIKESPLLGGKDFNWAEVSKTQVESIQNDLQDKLKETPALRVLTSLYIEYMGALSQPDTLLTTFGLGSAPSYAFYASGISPVLRLQLDDKSTFLSVLAKAEKNAGVTAVEESRDGISIHRYPFENKTENDADLIIALQDNFLVITIDIKAAPKSDLNMALGTEKPAQNLANTTILKDLANRSNYDGRMMFYIDHQEIVKGLTTTDGNSLAKSLTLLDKDAQDLSALRTPECSADYQRIASNWPRTTSGYAPGSLEPGAKKIQGKLQVEINDAKLLSQLQSLQGSIPDFVKNYSTQSMLDVSMAINVSKVASVVTSIWTEIGQTEYHCAELVKMQEEVKKQNPAMIGMGTAMVAGLKGVSASILSLDMDVVDDKPELKTIDALFTISASDPAALIASAAMFSPGLPTIPSDGTAIDFPLPMPLPAGVNIQPKIAIQGSHIVLFTGDESEKIAQSLANSALNTNGIFQFNMDYGQYMKIISKFTGLMQNTPGVSQSDINMINTLTQFDMKLSEGFNFNDQGFALDIDIEMK